MNVCTVEENSIILVHFGTELEYFSSSLSPVIAMLFFQLHEIEYPCQFSL